MQFAKPTEIWHSKWPTLSHNQGPDFDDISSFFSCEIDDAIQYIILGYGAQAPKIVIL